MSNFRVSGHPCEGRGRGGKFKEGWRFDRARAYLYHKFIVNNGQDVDSSTPFTAEEDGVSSIMDLYCECTKIGTTPVYSGFNYDVFKGSSESNANVALNLPRDFRRDRKAMELEVRESTCWPHRFGLQALWVIF